MQATDAAVNLNATSLGTGQQVHMLTFKCFDVVEAVKDVSKFEVSRPLFKPAPTLKRSRAHSPASREFDLGEILQLLSPPIDSPPVL